MTGHHPTTLRDVVLVAPSSTTPKRHRKLQQIDVSDVVQHSKPPVRTPGFQTQLSDTLALTEVNRPEKLTAVNPNPEVPEGRAAGN